MYNRSGQRCPLPYFEIDLIARDRNEYLFAECKWRNELPDLNVLKALKEKALVFGGKQEAVSYALFSKSGFTRGVIEEAERDSHVLLYDLKALFSL